MKLYRDEVSYFLWRFVGPILVLILLSAFLLYGIPVLSQFRQENEKRHAIVSSIIFSFNDTVTMVRYESGWWGLGGISSTKVSFLDGVNVTLGVLKPVGNISYPLDWFPSINTPSYVRVLENQTICDFTFSGNLAVLSGSVCTVQFKVVTHADNMTELVPLSILQIPKVNDAPVVVEDGKQTRIQEYLV